ncbi:fenitrothion hydrolase [Paraconexibacter antarcticus]|uniref:Fenitrothion hydrolase n=1 Tax=Paraconexibacter antarcticus TaxID=2949664 RepID=A0ABY5DXG1_9ACTN|nr:fenitrothion hydrolase [Paraconexibacter antarcticus]UTI66244.1 fenitrothion hydrolase [Paraconexibacter antarcticus]
MPGYLFAWAASIVLVASFWGLARLWNEPRLEGAPSRWVASLPAALEPCCGALGVAMFAGLMYCGLAGSADPDGNLLPAFVYVVFWIALVPLSLLLGDVFALFNPWRAIARGTGWLTQRAGPGRIGAPLPYPDRLGRWPATAAIFAFAWLELAYTHRGDPSTLAQLALTYAGVQLVGIAFFGVDAWTSRADGFAVYFNLFARLSALRRLPRELRRQPLLSGTTTLTAVPGTVALLCVMLGSTGFDGLSGTLPWRDLAPHLQHTFTRLGLSLPTASEAAASLGLIVMIAVIAGVFALGVRGMRAELGTRRSVALTRAFAHSLIPIACAYALAHYLTFLLVQGQAIAALVSDPLGHGADLLGTAHWTIDPRPLPRGIIWGLQVTALVSGHIAGLILAHDRALVLFPDHRRAARSQRWMLAVMVGYTSFGLFLLASAAK